MSEFVINSTDNVTLVTMNNIPNTAESLATIFCEIGNMNINVDMICQTAPYKDKINLSFTIDECDLTKTLTAVGKLKQRNKDLVTEVNSGNCKITLFSELLKTETGVAAKVFGSIAENDMQIKLITTSDVEISLLVDAVYIEKMTEILRRKFCVES